MSWNHPSSAAGKNAANGKTRTRMTGKAWTALALVIVGIAATAYLLMNGKQGGAVALERNEQPKRIVESAVASKGKPPVAEKHRPKQYQDMTNAEKLASIRAKYGDNIPENMRAIVYFLENPPKHTYHPAKSRESIFKHESERVIASFVTTEPGTWFMRQPSFDGRIDADFAKALSERIEVTDEDKAEEAELKRLVSETKAELAERVAAGEKVSDILNAVGKEYYELGQFKRSLQGELSKIKRNPQYTDQDVQDFVEAANKMLAQKGLPPMKMPKMVFRHISLRRAAEGARQQMKGE